MLDYLRVSLLKCRVGMAFLRFGCVGGYGDGAISVRGVPSGGSAVGYLGLALVFVWGGVLWGEFNFCFSGVFS